MSTKPGAFALSKYATLFVFSNKPLLIHHLRIVLPLMLLCDLAERFVRMDDSDTSATKTILTFGFSAVTLFLYACFVLGWHRASLRGPDPANERNPFNIDKADWKFIGLFVGVTVAFGAAMGVLNGGLSYVLETMGPRVQFAASIGVLLAMAFFLYLFLRASFLFPAQSVGVRLTWSDTKRAARGLYWPLIGANVIFGLIFTVAFVIYLLIAGFVASAAAAGLEGVAGVLMHFTLSIPVTSAGMLIVACCVSALSHAYQWGIQNNN